MRMGAESNFKMSRKLGATKEIRTTAKFTKNTTQPKKKNYLKTFITSC